MEPAIIGARLVQYVGGALVFGVPAFVLYAWPRAEGPPAWSGRMLRWGAGLVVVAGVAGLLLQTASLTGDPAAAVDPATLWFVLSGTQYGHGLGARLLLAAALLLLLVRRSSSRPWLALAIGAGVLASFAWTGHGAAGEGVKGSIRWGADIIHALASGLWLGALGCFSAMLFGPGASGRARLTCQALARFSGFGPLLVGVLVVTGLANTWTLIEPLRLDALWTTGYGRVLAAKLAVFAFMLALAAENRFRLTPALARHIESGAVDSAALRPLRISLALETTAGFAVLALVAWLGTLAPDV